MTKQSNKQKAAIEKMQKLREDFALTRNSLPWTAYALVGDKEDPETWKLPHHTKTIFRAIEGKIGLEHTVDWDRMPAAVAALSRAGCNGERVNAEAHEVLAAAQHLAGHYRKADKPLPNTLAILV